MRNRSSRRPIAEFLSLIPSLILFIGAVAPAVAQYDSCGELEAELVELLSYNKCRRSSDCAAVQLPQPFGCNRTVNAEVVPDIEVVYGEYDRYCGPFIYQCLRPVTSIWCRRGLCEGRGAMRNRLPSNSPLDHLGRPQR